jgi:hypothetical protein
MSRRIRVAVFAVTVALAALQLIPVDRSNPPVEGEIQVSAPVAEILRQSCYDCHSNGTIWPWFAYVAPVSWFISHDVHEGRSKLNFSTWNRLDDSRRSGRIHDIWDEASQGEMPLRQYLVMHPAARLSPEDLDVLRAWSQAPGRTGQPD